MTISSTTRKAGPFTGTGAQTLFPFSFKVFAASDLLAVQAVVATGVETVQAPTANYTVVLNADQNGNPGGVLTMLVPPPVGTTLTLSSQVPNTQSTDLTNAGGFYPKVITDALDRATIQIQQIAEKLGRSLSFGLSSSATGSLPNPVALTLLGWNAAGTAIQNFAGPASAAVSTFMAPVVAAIDAATARGLLGAISSAQSQALIQSQSAISAVTAGTATAFLAAVAPALTSNAPNTSLWVNFQLAPGLNATLAVNGQAALALICGTVSGTFINVPVNAWQPGWQTRVTLSTGGGAWIVEDMPPAAVFTLPPGQIDFFAFQTAPAGYLKANGAAVSRTVYAALFAAIGTVGGAGDGSTTFNVPDLRGEFIRGWDDGRGADAGRGFGTFQADALKSHQHTALMAATPGVDIQTFGSNRGDGNNNNGFTQVQPTGGTETRPRNIAFLACIKF